MKKFAVLLITLFILGISGGAKADVAVLIHGYMGSPGSWEQSGIASVLENNGWPRAGIVSTGPRGRVHLLPAPRGQNSKNKVYIVALPAKAPLNFQAQHLQVMLAFISNRHSGEPLILIGHSVGGVVARLALVKGLVLNPKALITIATPHLGTPRAGQALDLTNSPWPIEIVKEFFGGPPYQTLKSSRSLYYDISGPWPGSLLYHLNNSPHPDIKYVSVLRGQSYMIWGDSLVPTMSQDMNNVPQLKGKSSVYTTGTGHSLVAEDGFLLVRILRTITDK